MGGVYVTFDLYAMGSYGSCEGFDKPLNSNTVKAIAFVQITDTENLLGEFTPTGGWNALGGHSGVYYRVVESGDAEMDFYLVPDGKITINTSLNTNEIAALNNKTLGLKAYAIQYDYLTGYADGDTEAERAAIAWNILNPASNDG